MIYLNIITFLGHGNNPNNTNLEIELDDEVNDLDIDRILNNYNYLDYYLTYNNDSREFKTITKLKGYYNDDFNGCDSCRCLRQAIS